MKALSVLGVVLLASVGLGFAFTELYMTEEPRPKAYVKLSDEVRSKTRGPAGCCGTGGCCCSTSSKSCGCGSGKDSSTKQAPGILAARTVGLAGSPLGIFAAMPFLPAVEAPKPTTPVAAATP